MKVDDGRVFFFSARETNDATGERFAFLLLYLFVIEMWSFKISDFPHFSSFFLVSPKKPLGKNSITMSDMDEDYGFEYSDEEQDEEQVDVENQYYNAKGTFKTFVSLFFSLSLSLSLEKRVQAKKTKI